jgi:hypothetical protein
MDTSDKAGDLHTRHGASLGITAQFGLTSALNQQVQGSDCLTAH